jgi:hypothetical protein
MDAERLKVKQGIVAACGFLDESPNESGAFSDSDPANA